ncbi:MAG: hypothetical protein M0002_18810 [Rhodospirillales bacterium]|nr:hypothetical protein [Rhodospirillales bacterium]
MTADRTIITTRQARHPESAAAYAARQRCEEICQDLDAMRQRQPVAARVCEALLLRELATRLAPIMLELMADAAGEPEGRPLGRRHAEPPP